MRNIKIWVVFVAALTINSSAHSQCIQFGISKNKITVKEVAFKRGKCGRNAITKSTITGATGTSGTNGTNGTNGSNGSNGTNGIDGVDAPSIYGDGSAGVFNNAGVVSLSGPNLQFTSFTNSGSLTIESGAVIRVTGNFINTGTIGVATSASGGRVEFHDEAGLLNPAIRSPSTGNAKSNPQGGELGSNAHSRYFGLGGEGMSATGANVIFFPGKNGGGGGAGAYQGSGGDGGGSIVFLVGGTFTNDTGTINALGTSLNVCTGGGGGGIIIVASHTSISSAGTMNVSGGAGGAGSTACAPGGGGGGGFIKLIAPSIIATGSQTVSGGTGGALSTISGSVISGGSGGGGSYGSGGGGADAPTSGSTAAGSSGGTGAALSVVADPGALFR